MSTRPDISFSTRTDALDLAMVAHAEGYARGRADTLAAVRAVVEGVEGLKRGRSYEPHEEERAWGHDEGVDAVTECLTAALDTLAATPEKTNVVLP